MKKSTRNILIAGGITAALGAAIVPVIGFADAGKDYRAGHGMMQPFGGPRAGARMLERFDADEDGTVTQAEIDGATEEQLARFDQNSDGTLSLEEYQAMWLDTMREHMVDRFQGLDADGDAQVSAAEFNEPFERMVARLDRDGDQKLSSDEMRRRGRGDGKRGHHRREHWDGDRDARRDADDD